MKRSASKKVAKKKVAKKKVAKKKVAKSTVDVPASTTEKTPDLFASVQPPLNATSMIPELSDSLSAIVETTFSIDNPEEIYNELIEALNSRGDALTPGVIRTALAEAPKLYRKAHVLYVVARHDYEAFEASHTTVMATLREEAKTELEAEKAAGQLKKTITDQDVTSRVSRMFPEEYREMQERSIRARKTIEHLKHLVSVFQNRIRALATLAGTREEL